VVANPVSVYYPFALVEFLEAVESDEHEAVGEVLLVFLDRDGYRVTLRARREAIERMLDALR
jgi:hypothetical protein